MIDVPAPVADVATSFWAAALGWKVGETWGDHPEFTSLEPADGESFVHVQVIDAPPRLHLDFAVSTSTTSGTGSLPSAQPPAPEHRTGR
jgi:hypothetical protein